MSPRLRSLVTDPWRWVTLGGLAFFFIFLLYPAGLLLVQSVLGPDPGLTLMHYRQFFGKAYYHGALTASVLLAAGGTVGSVLVGVPLAVLTARYQIPAKGALRLLALVSLLSPPFIGAYAWVVLLGRAGFVTRWLAGWGLDVPPIYGWKGILLIFVLQHFAFVFFLTEGALGRVDASLDEAAHTLGAGHLRRLLTVTLPLALPSIAAGALLVFLTCLADFGTPVLIGEGLRVLPVLAYNELVSEIGGPPAMAATTSVLMALCSAVALGLQRLTVGGRRYATAALRPPPLLPLAAAARWAATLAGFALVGVAVLPQGVALVSSFVRTRGPIFTGQFGFDNYALALSRAPQAIANTFWLGGGAVLLMVAGAFLLGYVLARRPSWATLALDGLLALPHVVPGTALGIGLILAFGGPPLQLTGTGFILVLAFIIRRIGYAVRGAAAMLHQLAPALEEASVTLGVPPLATFFKVTARLMLPGVLAGALLSWVATVNELASSIMLYQARTATMTVVIYNDVLAMNFGTAAALATLLTLVTVVPVLLVQRWRRGAGEFTL